MASRLPYPQDHSTHIPFLVGLAARRRIETVFEFGAGTYSTLTFLDRAAFPDLRVLVSQEPELDWQKVVREATEDTRLHFLTDREISEPKEFDLVFVDNGPEQTKIKTIEMMAAITENPSIVVIHDAEHLPYQKAMEGFKTKIISYAFNPGTAICTNSDIGVFLVEEIFQSMDRAITANNHVSPDNVSRWVEIMNG